MTRLQMTDRLISEIIANMVIIVDTREQKNEHILEWLDGEGIPYIVRKMETGDYSFELPKYPTLNLDEKILIEKKNSLSEIAGNFTGGRERFIREFERVADDQKFHLLIEEATWKRVANGTYRSKLPPRSMRASLLTFSIRYSVPLWMVTKAESPELMYNIFRYELLEILKNIREKGL